MRGTQPTLKRLEAFAQATHAPIGFYFLAAPPVETMPIPDLRAVADESLTRPSPGLLDTIYFCQRLQTWYPEFMQSRHEPRLEFVGSAQASDDIVKAAARMLKTLGFDLSARTGHFGWGDEFRLLIEQADAHGILVTVSGAVGGDKRCRLDLWGFRGFALADPWASLAFVNGAGTKAVQVFTLVHEFAHLWLGRSGISDPDARVVPDEESERWCNRVAAELLVPLDILRDEFVPRASLELELIRPARHFKVSRLVILLRLHDVGRLSRNELRVAYDAELSRLKLMQARGGGIFNLTLGSRVSKRFARALVVSTLEGHTGFTEAFRLLGPNTMASFDRLRRNLEVGY